MSMPKSISMVSGILHWLPNQNPKRAIICKFTKEILSLGENTHPIYKWLKAKLPGILSTEGIKWNFTKFLINCEGIPVQRYGPLHQPKDMEADIIAQIKSCEAKVLNSTVSTTNTSKEL